MRIIILFASLFFSYFASANLSESHSETATVKFSNLNTEHMSPVKEMVEGVNKDINKRGEEIQLALGGNRRHGHGHGGHDGHGGYEREHGHEHEHEREREHGHEHGHDEYRHEHGHGHGHHWHVHEHTHKRQPPKSNVCRSGPWFCKLSYLVPVGTPCECYGPFGYLWFHGKISFN